MGGTYYFRTQPRISAGNTVANTDTSEETSLYTDEVGTVRGQVAQASVPISENTSVSESTPTAEPTDESQPSSASQLVITQTPLPTTAQTTATQPPTQSTAQVTTQTTTQAIAEMTPAPTSGVSYSYSREMEAEVLVLINKYRTDAGLTALSSETTIQAWSDLRAAEIVSQGIAAGNSVLAITHIRPNGSNPWEGYQGVYTYFAENIAGGQTTAEAVVTEWMNSPGHKENIMNGNYTTVGISCICNNGVYYWVQDFVGS